MTQTNRYLASEVQTEALAVAKLECSPRSEWTVFLRKKMEVGGEEVMCFMSLMKDDLPTLRDEIRRVFGDEAWP